MITFQKFIVLWFNLILGLSFINADGFDLEKYKMELLVQNNNYQQALLNYQLDMLTYRAQRWRWFPQSYLSLSPSINFDESAIATYTNSLDATLGFSQKLPFGNTLNGSISQSFSMNETNSWNFNYTPSASLSILTPFLLGAPALFRDILEWEFKFSDISISIARLNLIIAQRQNFSETIAALATYMLALKTVDIATRKYNIMLQRGVEDEQLWTFGRITTIELTSRDRDRYQNYMDLLQKQKALLVAKHKLTLIGLDESFTMTVLSQWIESIESCLVETDYAFQDKISLQQFIFYKSWKDLLNNQINSIPSLNWSLILSPSSKTNSGSNLLESIENYWMSHINWNWSVSVSMRISLSPWDAFYNTNKVHQLRNKIFNHKRECLHTEEVQERELRQKILKMHDELRIQSEKSLQLTRDRLQLSESLYAAGRLSELDLKLQQIVVEESECSLLQARIDKILAILSFY